jgi:hypothetical protein
MTVGDQAAGGGDAGLEPVGFFLPRCRESYHYTTGVAPEWDACMSGEIIHRHRRYNIHGSYGLHGYFTRQLFPRTRY